MKIGVDLRSIEGGSQYRGIGRYATHVLGELSNIDHNNEYVFFVSHKNAKLPALKLHTDYKHSLQFGPSPGLRTKRFIRILYASSRPLPVDRYGLDVFFQLDVSHSVSAGKTPVVSVLYDLIPHIFKEDYQVIAIPGHRPIDVIGHWRDKRIIRARTNAVNQYEKSAKVISISKHSKKDLLRLFPSVLPSRVVAIPLAADALPAATAKTRKEFAASGLAKESYCLYIGGGDPRKGLLSLVDMFEKVWQEHPNVKLVIAGKEVVDATLPATRKLIAKIKACSHPKNVVRLGHTTDEFLSLLYGNAEAFVFPSRYEGFGLPILEAMMADCPVVCYDNSSIPEVAGDAALMVPDGQDMAPAINKLLSDPKLHASYVAAGRKQAAEFTWRKTAEKTLAVLESTARAAGKAS